MRRRELIAGLVGAAALPLVAHAQQTGQTRRLGVLTGYNEDDLEAQARLGILRHRLAELGWTAGRNLQMEERWSRGSDERARNLVRELVNWKPDVILGETTSVVRALKQTAGGIPIVFTNLFDPNGSGFVASLSRPGGNITGFTNFESSMGGKWLELLKEVVPGTTRTGAMFNPKVSTHIAAGYYLESLAEAARHLGVEQVPAAVESARDIEAVAAAFAGKSGGALIVLPDTFTLVHRELIVGLMAEHRIPAVYSFRLFAASGGMASYGINASDQFPRAATYIDRILRGEKPADLPVQAPTKYELVRNLEQWHAVG